MSVPRLNRQLVLENPQRSPDGAGGFAETWTPLGEHWAEVSARTGRERSQAGAPVSVAGYRIVVRATPQGAVSRPRPEQRFRDGSRVFVIRAVAERDAAGLYLTCFAEEEVAA